jgi:hypothetical protein
MMTERPPLMLPTESAERRACRAENLASRCEVGDDWRNADKFWEAAASWWERAGKPHRAKTCRENMTIRTN